MIAKIGAHIDYAEGIDCLDGMDNPGKGRNLAKRGKIVDITAWDEEHRFVRCAIGYIRWASMNQKRAGQREARAYLMRRCTLFCACVLI